MAATGAEIGKAYVSIIPKLSGAGVNAMMNQLGGETAKNAGSKAGGAFSGGMADGVESGQGIVGAAASKIAIAAAAAAAAVGTAAIAIGKQSFNAYADYEQLVGGVETLFGAGGQSLEEYAKSVGKSVDDASGQFDKLTSAQDTVFADAKSAWKDCGLSANQYMEQVTSFSASLTQSLGGDTEAAAKAAKIAMVDMSDNANKMGTSVDMIQNAYQGFAKQNYTMLDNLKLGYGGTKTEMERLISDANKVKEANGEMADLSIDSFADVTEAIHIIQTQMGITGTTAKEASTTIQGSLGALDAAWQNLLVGFADENADIGALLADMGTAIQNAASNIIPRIFQIAQGMAQALPMALPQMIQGAVDLFGGITQGLATSLPIILSSVMQAITNIVAQLPVMIPQMIQGAVTFFSSLITGLLQELPNIIANLGLALTSLVNALVIAVPQMIQGALTFFGAILTALLENAPLILTTLMDTITGLIENIANNTDGMGEKAGEFFGQILNQIIEAAPGILSQLGSLLLMLLQSVISNAPSMLSNAARFIGNILTAIVQAIPGALSALGGLLWDLLGKVGSMAGDMLSRGAEFIGKLPEAIRNAVGDALNAIGGLLDDVFNEIKNFDLLQAGKDLIQGLINGIGSMGQAVIDAVGGIANSAVDGLKGLLGIASPSKVFAKLGDYTMQGFAVGLERSTSDVTASIKSAATEIYDTASATLSPTISATMGTGASAVGATTQVINFNQPIESPDQVARALRLQQRYGLAAVY